MSEFKSRVLIVDDVPQNLHLLRETLKGSCKLSIAKSGAQALDLVARGPAPDLILLDVMMPGMNGYEVCEKLKSDPETKDIPIIFVTAMSESGDEERGLSLGAVDYVTKPFQPELIKARVSNQLELKKHRDNLQELVESRTEELLESRASQHKLESELNVAKQLQLSMLRDTRPQECEMATFLQPAKAVGGDLFDYMTLDSGHFLFCVGDVSDKGVPAALFMVQALTLLRALANQFESPGELLAAVNNELCKQNDACMFVTLVLGLFDPTNGELRLSSGGHEPPLLLGDEPTYLRFEGGPALGLVDDAEFPVHNFSLRKSDTLVLYSDGITDALNSEEDSFGEERLQNACPQRATPSDIVDSVNAALTAFVGETEQFDDMTLMVIKPHPEVNS
jgi:sigma-B regulation protein RsbU (phosphoserine phosphatase)